MFRKQSVRIPKWAIIIALMLLLATTALAAAQSPDLLLPLVTGEGTQGVPAEQVAPEAPVGESAPPLLEPDPNAPVDDYDLYIPAETAAINAFDSAQWTVQNRLGVGTQSPAVDLDVTRNVNLATRVMVRNLHAGNAAQTQLYLSNTSSSGFVLEQFGTGYTGTWGPLSLKNMARMSTTSAVRGLIMTTGGAWPLILGTANQERMRITPGGQVGIGTATPVHQLSIAGGPGWTASLWKGAIDLTNESAIGWRANSSGYSFGMGYTNNGFHFFRTDSAPGTTGSDAFYDLSITDNGLVGIGITNPANKLHVNGSIRSEGDLYADNYYLNSSAHLLVPDYVFEPDYPLMSLDELRTYVATEKHLPNVPDAEQIAQGGLNLSEFQMKLLEKTEELTLYTLAQDEQIKSLQQENQAMQQDNLAKDEQLAAMQQMIADLETRLATLEEQE